MVILWTHRLQFSNNSLILFHHRCAVEAELVKYIGEAYPKGVCSVYCTNGKDVEEPGSDFELVVVISAARHSPQNFWCVELAEVEIALTTVHALFLPYSYSSFFLSNLI